MMKHLVSDILLYIETVAHRLRTRTASPPPPLPLGLWTLATSGTQERARGVKTTK